MTRRSFSRCTGPASSTRTQHLSLESLLSCEIEAFPQGQKDDRNCSLIDEKATSRDSGGWQDRWTKPREVSHESYAVVVAVASAGPLLQHGLYPGRAGA